MKKHLGALLGMAAIIGGAMEQRDVKYRNTNKEPQKLTYSSGYYNRISRKRIEKRRKDNKAAGRARKLNRS